MAIKAYKQCQLAQTMVIYLFPETQVSLSFDLRIKRKRYFRSWIKVKS